MARIMTATEFRAKCLGLLDWVAKTGETIIITKRDKLA
jgi:antitoxin (DNA-binding transcriptional repressor) of toxin-antitoxin stability system